MIEDAEKLRELVEELATLSLEQRRSYIAEIERTEGAAAAEQIKQALTAHWQKR
jgi:hypothetical protein